MTIGEKVSILRLHYGMSQKQLAEKAFAANNEGTVKRIERYGQDLKYSDLCKLAKALGVRYTDLVSENWDLGLIKRLNLQI